MLFLTFSVLLYFLPAIIARNKPDAGAIFLVNLFFGWTIIGWFIALLWACARERYATVPAVPVSPIKGNVKKKISHIGSKPIIFFSAFSPTV